MGLTKAGRWLEGLLPAVRAERRLRHVQAEILLMQGRLLQALHLAQRLDHLNLGSSATYVGNNRVLVRIVAGAHLFMMYVHADDKLISPSLIVNGRYEPELTAYFAGALKFDSHCIDVGANLGYFTCFMAKHCPQGQVIGLEPNPPIHALAVDNMLLNALSENAKILNLAASDREGELTLFHRIGRAGNTSIAPCGDEFTRFFQEPPEEAFQVATIRIDDLRDRMSGRVDFLKIDVEGAEPLAFAGARETIRDNPQLRIVMEWAPSQIVPAGFDIAQFVRDIAALGLRASVLTIDGPQSISNDELTGMGYQPGILFQRDAP